ncbi:MAG: glycosyltransferase [Lutibacter sp.]|nr:glycosyltransferase [Lutibacter sp.]
MAKAKKKILFIHHGTGIGGASICLKELVLSMADEIEPTILCLKNSSAVPFFRESGIETLFLNTFFFRNIYSFWPHIEGTTYSLTSLILMPRFFISYILNALYFSKKVLKKYKFDILYLNSTFLTDWTILNKKKTILHVREPLGKGFLGIRRLLFKYVISKKVDHIIAISRDNANRINLLSKTTVIYDPMRAINYKLAIKTDLEKKYYLYLGGLQMIKGFYVLVSALPYLNSNVRIFFAGNINYQSRSGFFGNLKKMVEWYWLSKLRKSDKVIEIGLINNVYDYLRSSDYLLFPSTIPHFAGPVLEAYRVGKPVVVSDVKGMDEIVAPNTGFFFTRGNAKKLADTINYSATLSTEKYALFEQECLNKYELINSENKAVISVIYKILG